MLVDQLNGPLHLPRRMGIDLNFDAADLHHRIIGVVLRGQHRDLMLQQKWILKTGTVGLERGRKRQVLAQAEKFNFSHLGYPANCRTKLNFYYRRTFK